MADSGQALIDRAKKQPRSAMAREPVTITHLGGMALLIVAMIAVLLIVGDDPSRTTLGIALGVIIALVMLGQLLLTRGNVFSPSSVADIVDRGLDHFAPVPSGGDDARRRLRRIRRRRGARTEAKR